VPIAPQTVRPPDAKPIGRTQEDWDSIGREKALCGMVNAVLSAGGTPNIHELAIYLTEIEQKAESMTKDARGPF